MGFALVVLAVFLVLATWYVYGDAIRMIWRTRHLRPEDAARWIIEDDLEERDRPPWMRR